MADRPHAPGTMAHICCETPEALLQLAGGVRVLYSYCIGEDGKLHPQRLLGGGPSILMYINVYVYFGFFM